MEQIIELCPYIEFQLCEANKLIGGLETGFHELNKITGGCRHSELITVASENKMGI